jgi:kumamolisin
MSADPEANNGWTIAYDGNIYVNWVGGTSCCSPAFSGYLARIGKTSKIADRMYAKALSSGGRVDPRYFGDVVTGDNDSFPATDYLYRARTGFDQCSGLGTPVGTGLRNIL